MDKLTCVLTGCSVVVVAACFFYLGESVAKDYIAASCTRHNVAAIGSGMYHCTKIQPIETVWSKQ